MDAQPAAPKPTTSGAETIEQHFQRLADVWHKGTWHLSSATRMADHPAYREIIALGEAVVPLLLRELARKPDHWFSALKAITGAAPVAPADRGRADRITAAWLEAAQKRRH